MRLNLAFLKMFVLKLEKKTDVKFFKDSPALRMISIMNE